MSFADIGRKLGISSRRVQQLYYAALVKMKYEFEKIKREQGIAEN